MRPGTTLRFSGLSLVIATLECGRSRASYVRAQVKNCDRNPQRAAVVGTHLRPNTPADIVSATDVTRAQKIEALDSWALDVERRLASTAEGMPSQGQSDADLSLLDRIREARKVLDSRSPAASNGV